MSGVVHNVALIGFDGIQSLDIVGPVEVFSKANQHRRPHDPRYEIHLASPDGGTIQSNSCVQIGETTAVRDLPEELDTIIIAGGSEEGLRSVILDSHLLDWLRSRRSSTRRIASVCTGAFVLAYAGLLDGKRATTHWHSCKLLQELRPEVEVDCEAIYVDAPPIHTSAGISTGMDLCLSFVEADCCTKVALDVARDLVLFMRRPGGQAQFSTALKAQFSAAPRLNELIAKIVENPKGDLSVPRLADQVGMSERTFLRAFKKEVGTTPAKFIQSVRLDRARTLLETTQWPLARIAHYSGFTSLDSLHRIFLRELNTTPAAYRTDFGPKE